MFFTVLPDTNVKVFSAELWGKGLPIPFYSVQGTRKP